MLDKLVGGLTGGGGGIPILGDAMQILNPQDTDGDGNTFDQRLEGAGGLIGTAVGGPLGGAIGKMAGGLLGDMF